MDHHHPSGGDPAELPASVAQVLHNRYRIERSLGHGGMGEVLLAYDELLGRRVALKRMHAGGEDRIARRRLMLKEARRASQINDPHVTSIHDVIDGEDGVLLVLEYVDGVTLRQRLETPISLAEFYDLATQCAEGLAAAHAYGVIHRDIKPENLMLTGGGLVKILDFGIAQRTDPALDTTTSLADSRSKGAAGTPPYMAPEAHMLATADERTDIFALGVVFYELLTARRPFEGATYGALLHEILNATPMPVTDSNPAAGAELSRLIARMLARDRDARVGSAAEVLEGLKRARAGVPYEGGHAAGAAISTSADTTPVTLRSPARPSRSRPSALALVAVAAVALAALWWQRSLTPALPKDVNLAILAPSTPGASDDFANFALGGIELLAARLQKHSDRHGFQMASFLEGHEEKVHSAGDARKVLGANVALTSTLEQQPGVFRARLELRDTQRDRVMQKRNIVVPATKPFELLDALYREAAAMVGQTPRPGDAVAETGIRGAGTLRFYLQGRGRLRAAETDADTQKAIDEFEQACRIEPEAAMALAGLANSRLRLYNAMHDTLARDSAKALARRAVELEPSRAEAHLLLGYVLTSEKRLQESIMEFARAVDLNPTDDEACYRLGRTYARLVQPEKERGAYQATLQRRPHCWRPWWWLATFEYRQGRVDASIHHFKEMIHRAPDLYSGYSGLGGLLIFKGDYPQAIETLRHAVALRPTKEAFSNLGTAYFNSGQFTESVEAYNQAFQFGAPDYLTWLNLGDAYYWLRNRKDESAGAYTQAVRLGREEIASRAQKGRPVDARIFADLATVLPKLGQPDTARVYVEHALRADSTNTFVQYDAAVTLWQLDERPRAVAWLRKAVEGGYPAVWLRDSPMFNDWRENPEFRTLVSAANPGPQKTVAGN